MNKQLNIYLVSQDTNNSFDSFDSFVVCAYDEEEARQYLPKFLDYYDDDNIARNLKDTLLHELENHYYNKDKLKDKLSFDIDSMSNQDLINKALLDIHLGDNLNFRLVALQDWCIDINKIKVKKVGIADSSMQQGEIICASFNAG
jgi:hypothetical protein